jgi:hypothetical protein
MKGQDKMTLYFGCTIFPQNVYRTVIVLFNETVSRIVGGA